jgi:hypothetical protein
MTTVVDLLEKALVQLGRPSAGSMLKDGWHGPSRRQRLASKATRQKQHEAFMRAFATAIAGSMVLATEDAAYADFVLSPQFGNLHPYNPECWSKFEHLLRTGRTGSPDGWARLWNRAARLWVSESPKIPGYPLERLGLFNALMAASGAPLLIFGEAYKQRWHQLWRRARENGAIEAPFARNCLALLGSHAGACDAHVEWLLRHEARSLEIADLLLFVRTDRSDDLPQLFARIVRNEPGELSDYLLPAKPAATLTALFRYIRTTMRRPANFCNVGLVLATVSWAVAGIELAERLVQDGVIDRRAHATLLCGLITIEEVQRMEKNRFWHVVDETPAAPLRERIQDLWSKISAQRLAIPPG